jgi:chaperonin GroES
MNIRPLRDQILVKQDPPKEKIGTLFVPQGKEEFENFGTVIAVGPGTIGQTGEIIPNSVKPGDRVLFKRRPASVLGEDFKDQVMLRDEDMLAVLEEGAVGATDGVS